MAYEGLSFRQTRIALRPARVAVLLDQSDPDWMNNCLRVIEWLCDLWSGESAILVPTDGKSIDERFWYVLDRFDADYLLFFRKTNRDFKLADPQGYEARLTALVNQQHNLSGQSRETIDQIFEASPLSRFIISTALQEEIALRLNPFSNDVGHIHGEVKSGETPQYPMTRLAEILAETTDPKPYLLPILPSSLPTDLRLIAASVFGQLPDPTNQALLSNRGLLPALAWALDKSLEILTRAIANVPTPARSEAASDGARIPLQQTMAGLSYVVPFMAPHETPITLIVGESLADFCLYYDALRLCRSAFWLPVRLHEAAMHSIRECHRIEPRGEASYTRFILEKIAGLLSTGRPSAHVLLSSVTLPEEELARIRDTLSTHFAYPMEITTDVTRLFSRTFTAYERGHTGALQMHQFWNGEGVNLCDTPMPRTLKSIRLESHFWIAEVWVEHYKLPRRRVLGPLTLCAQHYGNDAVRISRDGIAYFCPNQTRWFSVSVEDNLIRPQIRLLSDDDLFVPLFEQLGLSTRASDKGNYHREIVRLFGGLHEAGQFLGSVHGRKFLDGYLDRSPSSEQKGIYVQSAGRRYLSFKNIQELAGLTTEQTIQLTDDLTSKGMLSRGLIFQCSRCLNSSWYGMGELTDVFRCARCRTEQRYLHRHWKSPEEPRWYYELNEVVYQSHCSNVQVPILTALAMKRSARESFFYLPETKFTGSVLNFGDKEIDITACRDGNLILAEASISDCLGKPKREQTELAQLHQMAQLLHCESVVLATSSEQWRSGTVERAKAEFNGRIQLTLFAGPDLEKAAVR
jgi:hypothetical protein